LTIPFRITAREWPATIDKTSEPTTLKAVLYGPYGVGILVLEISLPLVFESACKDVRRREVGKSKSSKNRGDGGQELIHDWGERKAISEP